MYDLDSDTEDTPIIQDQTTFKTMKFMPEWPEIKQKLSKMHRKELNSREIIETIDHFKYISLKNKYESYHHYPKKKYENHKLLDLYQKQLPQIFSKIAQFVLTYNHDLHYPLFKRNENYQYKFTKEKVLYLICSMALCLFPKQHYHSYENQINFSSHIDFHYIFKSQRYKTKAIMQFIKKQIGNKNMKEEKLTIKRLSVVKNINDLITENGEKKMCKMTMASDNASIQDFYGDLKVDFANSYIGGGALSSGCVQEQIMFANHPQMFITQLICQSMMPNQAIGMIGFKKYNKNQGYSHSTTYAGLETYTYQFDQQNRAKQYIIAIDALLFIKDSLQQFKPKHVNRQILKAYCGFKFQDGNLNRLVTGNWGCGAFGGNLRLKCLIQWLACSLTKKQMIYCPFGFSQLIHDAQFFKNIQNLTVKDFYKILIESSHKISRQPLLQPDIYIKIKQALHKSLRSHST